jgi:hypothetical protein
MRFDIDLPQSRVPEGEDLMTLGEAICTQVIERVIEVVKDEFQLDLVPLQDIIITESHGEGKYSRHIVVTSFTLENNRQAKALFKKILTPNLETQVKAGNLDHNIYTKTQCFRLLGSVKCIGASRQKVLLKTYHFAGQDYHLKKFPTKPVASICQQLALTLITYTDDLPMFSLVVPDEIVYNRPDLTDEATQKIIECVNQEFPGVFKPDKSKNGAVSFVRIPGMQSYCDACMRYHGLDGGKRGLFVRLKGRQIVAYCGSSEGVGVLLGRLDNHVDLTNTQEAVSHEPMPVVKIGLRSRTLERAAMDKSQTKLSRVVVTKKFDESGDDLALAKFANPTGQNIWVKDSRLAPLSTKSGEVIISAGIKLS